MRLFPFFFILFVEKPTTERQYTLNPFTHARQLSTLLLLLPGQRAVSLRVHGVMSFKYNNDCTEQETLRK